MKVKVTHFIWTVEPEVNKVKFFKKMDQKLAE